MFYSAFAGFIEPGESFEDAVAREMWEEAGVRVWNIRYHSGQPWVRIDWHFLGQPEGPEQISISHTPQLSWLASIPERIPRCPFEPTWIMSLLVRLLGLSVCPAGLVQDRCSMVHEG